MTRKATERRTKGENRNPNPGMYISVRDMVDDSPDFHSEGDVRKFHDGREIWKPNGLMTRRQKKEKIELDFFFCRRSRIPSHDRNPTAS